MIMKIGTVGTVETIVVGVMARVGGTVVVWIGGKKSVKHSSGIIRKDLNGLRATQGRTEELGWRPMIRGRI